jgi:hypothetical protein
MRGSFSVERTEIRISILSPIPGSREPKIKQNTGVDEISTRRSSSSWL